MIPKKTGTETDLDMQINKDLEKAQEEQRKKINKNRPKLAQAVTSKYFKFFVMFITACIIGYRMFFAPSLDEPRKKKLAKNKITKSNNKKEAEQQRFADKSINKSSNGEISKEKPDSKKIISLDTQTISNSETLGSISVPKLNIPSVPTLPVIDKITLKDEQNNDEQKKEAKQNNKEDVNVKKTNTKKIKKKIRDADGKSKIVEVEVEVDQNGNIIKESETKDEKQKSSFLTSGGQKKHQSKQEQIADLGSKALDEMFILSGKGGTGQQRSYQSSNSKKDFIIFDAGINEREVVSEQQNTNVSRITNPENTIIAGKVMEATLLTAINSETKGGIMATVSRDVYGEAGKKILIPSGSKLYGSYTTAETATQTRLLLTWTRVVRPDNVVISMSSDTYDQSGKKGIEGDINTRYGELFKNSLLYSFVTLGTAVAIEKIAGIKGQTSIVAGNGTSVTNTSPANAAATSVIETAQDIAEKMTEGLTKDLNPVISIPQGMVLKIISRTDIVIDMEYKRRSRSVDLE